MCIRDRGTTLVTSTATDLHGLTSTCTFNVTVNDTQPPLILCPVDITVNAAAGQCTSNVFFIYRDGDHRGLHYVARRPRRRCTIPMGTTLVTSTATDPN